MRPIRFEFTSDMPCSAAQLWCFHMRPDALDILSPPGTRVEDGGDGVSDGSVVTLRLGWWPITTTWKAMHASVRPLRSFTDVALESPFAFWTHQHTIEALGGGASRLRDVVHYLPPRWLPAWAARPLTALALRLLFRWRHGQTRRAVRYDRCGKPVAQWLRRPVSGGA